MSHWPVLRALAAAVVAVLVLPSCSMLGGGKDTYHLTAFFPRAVSLYPESSVTVLGLEAGNVDAVEVEGDRIRVELSVNADVPLPADVRAGIVPASLIGERNVQLFPAWREGEPRAQDGDVLDLDRTEIPVEPDEALNALKEFLESLDPDGLGRLITNASESLTGNGQTLGSALDGLSDLVANFEENDQVLLSILDNFDQLTTTLTTREEQLGRVIDSFGQATEVLASERQSIETLLHGLAELSEDGLDLVVEHSPRLAHDIEVLTRLAASVVANLGAVEQLLDAGPIQIRGFLGAHNPELRATDVRNNMGPLAQAFFGPLFEALGFEVGVCLEVDVVCPGPTPVTVNDTPIGPPPVDLSVVGQGGQAAVPGSVDANPLTPMDAIVSMLADRGDVPAEAPPEPSASVAERLAGGAASAGGFLRDAAAGLIGVVS